MIPAVFYVMVKTEFIGNDLLEAILKLSGNKIQQNLVKFCKKEVPSKLAKTSAKSQ